MNIADSLVSAETANHPLHTNQLYFIEPSLNGVKGKF